MSEKAWGGQDSRKNYLVRESCPTSEKLGRTRKEQSYKIRESSYSRVKRSVSVEEVTAVSFFAKHNSTQEICKCVEYSCGPPELKDAGS